MFGAAHDIELLREITAESIANEEKAERDLRAYVYFFEFLLRRETKDGDSITGCHFSQRGDNTLLVVKRSFRGIPQVAFVTEKFPTGCIVTFGRLVLEDRVKWHKDKYAKT